MQSSNLLKLAVNGALGRMGQELISLITQQPTRYKLQLAKINNSQTVNSNQTDSYVSKFPSSPDFSVMIDFSMPSSTIEALHWCRENSIAMVIGTTGFNSDQMKIIDQTSNFIPIIMSPNMSLSVNVLLKLVNDAARYLVDYEAEIIESHHRYKRDSPSGTALKIGQTIAKARGIDFASIACFNRFGISHQDRPTEQIGFSVIRAGDIIGKHSVELITDGEILRLESEINNRKSFAHGALLAAQFIAGAKVGIYSMEDVLFSKQVHE